MDQIAPEVYGSLNYAPKKFAAQSLIILGSQNRLFDTIVDIGCGDGGVTKELAQKLRHRQLVAVDVDPAMTAYAQQTNPEESIQYKTQDVSAAWDELSEDIRALEGKVTLIFSNFVLHYIRDKSRLVANFSRLLTTAGAGGCIHANIFIPADLNRKLPVSERAGHWTEATANDRQIQAWRQALSDSGLRVDKFEIIDDVWRMSRKEMIDFLPVLIHDFRPFFESGDRFEAEVKVLANTVFEAYCSPRDDEPNPNAWTQFTADESPAAEAGIQLNILRLVAIKKS